MANRIGNDLRDAAVYWNMVFMHHTVVVASVRERKITSTPDQPRRVRVSGNKENNILHLIKLKKASKTSKKPFKMNPGFSKMIFQNDFLANAYWPGRRRGKEECSKEKRREERRSIMETLISDLNARYSWKL